MSEEQVDIEDVTNPEAVEVPVYEGVKEEYHEHVNAELYDSDPDYKKALEIGFDPTRDPSDPNYANYKSFLRTRDAFDKDKSLRAELDEMQKGISTLIKGAEESARESTLKELEAEKAKAIEDLDPAKAAEIQSQIERQKSQPKAQEQGEHAIFSRFRQNNPMFEYGSTSFDPDATLILEDRVNRALTANPPQSESDIARVLEREKAAVEQKFAPAKQNRVAPKVAPAKTERAQASWKSKLTTPSSIRMYEMLEKEHSKEYADNYAKGVVGE